MGVVYRGTKTNQNRTVGGAYRDLTESYNYDHLNRLTSVTQGTESLVMDYDALGNLTSKSDVGAYTYGSGAGPHAVTSAGGQTYVYDANGNQVSGDGRTIGYTVFNKPNDITRGARDVDVAYGPNRNRYMRVDNEGQSSEVTTHYIGSIERIWRASGVVETKRYIDGEVIVTRSDDGSTVTSSVAVLLKDHLGSTDLIVDDAGQIVQAQSFDPWGKRRAPDYASLIGAAWYDYDNSATTRGFTGHEQLDPVGLVHMNGRVYDPKLGRFLSADPFVQAPANTQSYNRYAYVLNNPLSYTDPTGHFFFALAAAAKIALTEGISVYAAAGWAGAAGFADALVSGASFKDALRSGVLAGATAGAFVAIGPAAQGGFWTNAVHTLKFGSVGGISSVLQGGKFGHGFLSAGFSGALSGRLTSVLSGAMNEQTASVIAQMVVGGTMSEVAGGKFANGAAYAAFSMVVEGVTATFEGEHPGSSSPSAVEEVEIGSEWNELVGPLPESPQGDPITMEQYERSVAAWPEGRMDSSVRKEIRSVLGNKTFRSVANKIWSASSSRGAELGALTVYEADGVYRIYSSGIPVTKSRMYLTAKDSSLGRHVFDWHPHPSGTPLSSRADRITSLNRGPMVIKYGGGRFSRKIFDVPAYRGTLP